MITRILVAYDGSEPAERAFDFAVDLAGKYRASLTVLAVARPPEIGDDVETQAIIENSLTHYRRLLAQLQKRAASKKMDIALEVRVGHPAEQIVNYAEQHRVDAIVMGHRGRTLLERWRLGSISQRVLQYAHCPVIIVR
jgi:nucleotide-binding universal stress UspA family protein